MMFLMEWVMSFERMRDGVLDFLRAMSIFRRIRMIEDFVVFLPLIFV